LLIVKEQENSRQGSRPSEIGKNGFTDCSALDFSQKRAEVTLAEPYWRQIKTFARGSDYKAYITVE
jgi:hypothetical protein